MDVVNVREQPRAVSTVMTGIVQKWIFSGTESSSCLTRGPVVDTVRGFRERPLPRGTWRRPRSSYGNEPSLEAEVHLREVYKTPLKS